MEAVEATGRVRPCNTWYIVVPTNGDQHAPRIAYTTRSHAEAVAHANNYEYSSVAPWGVLPVEAP